MNADQLLADYVRQIDDVICEYAAAAAQHLLDAGASVDDLPRLMQPIVQRLSEYRADAVAKLERHTIPIRAIEARMAVLNAQIERLESGAVVH